MRCSRAVLVLVIAICSWSGPVHAAGNSAPLFMSPFLSAVELMKLRGSSPSAAHRLTVRMMIDVGEYHEISNGMLDVAGDWALWWPTGGGRTLFDFKLGRQFHFDNAGQGYTASSLLTGPAFFYWERLNRKAMNAGLEAAGIPDLAQDCDTDTELGIGVVGGSRPIGPAVKIFADDSGDVIAAQCGERRIGMIRLSRTPIPSPVLWATIARQIHMHPRLLERARAVGRLPATIETDHQFPGNKYHAQWMLTGIDAATVPYPLESEQGEATFRDLSTKLHPSIISLASEAVKGSYGGGPPDIASWTAKVKKIAEKDKAAAVMEAMQVTMMFPGHLEGCKKARADWLCRFMDTSRDLWRTEPALVALNTILSADPRDPRRFEKVMKAMVKASASPLGKHAALQAAFAIAMQSADPPTWAEAEKAGLAVSQFEALQQAIEDYPYNPLYWLDLSQAFLFGEWDFVTGMFLTDVAMSLPMPEATKGNQIAEVRIFFSSLPAKFPSLYP
jgi:hypothetical protein